MRRYAEDDVHEAAGVARLLGGAAFALARMAPEGTRGWPTPAYDQRYRPMLVRLICAQAPPSRRTRGDGTSHSGAALHLFATRWRTGSKADVAESVSILMREHRIGPSRDRLGALLALVEQLVEQRLEAKGRAKGLPPGSPERFTEEAMSAAMKIVVNSAYGYLGAVGLTRFSDVHAANEVTRHGRELLGLICGQLAARGVTLLQADTDGVYFTVPEGWTEADERRAVAEVASLLPALVRLEFDGRFDAMLSHEPKNYALKKYSGEVVLRGVAFRSSRAEPFGEDMLRRALARLLVGDVAGVREEYVRTVLSLRRRELPSSAVAALVRLTRSREQYLAIRDRRRELPYEAALASGSGHWRPGERVRVYRQAGGRGALLPPPGDDDRPDGASTSEYSPADPRDYDIEHYVRVLRVNFASRLVRAFAPEDFNAVFEDPEQPSLFAPDLRQARPILHVLSE
ncbi:MAG: DNA polymerase domain-containing protein [Polyangiaceae bacterium]